MADGQSSGTPDDGPRHMNEDGSGSGNATDTRSDEENDIGSDEESDIGSRDENAIESDDENGTVSGQPTPGDGEQTASNWWNRLRYGAYAPVYDWAAKPFEAGRKRAIERVDPAPDDRILILGCGTGLDLEYLPREASVTAIDVSERMVDRTRARAEALGMDVDARVGDAQSLPFADERFDVVLLHLVISVVPGPQALVDEAARVLAPGGRIAIYDKFVPAGSTPSLLRRAVNPLARLVFADLTRRLDPLFADTDLELEPREPFLGGLYLVTVARPTSDE